MYLEEYTSPETWETIDAYPVERTVAQEIFECIPLRDRYTEKLAKLRAAGEQEQEAAYMADELEELLWNTLAWNWSPFWQLVSSLIFEDRINLVIITEALTEGIDNYSEDNN